VKWVCYFGNGCCDDGIIECHSESNEVERDDDKGETRVSGKLGNIAIVVALVCNLDVFGWCLVVLRGIDSVWQCEILLRRGSKLVVLLGYGGLNAEYIQ
jgi:hypothetical protein